MAWILIIAYAGFIFWRIRRARELNAERAASGQLHSPLYKAANALVLVLFGLTFYIGYIHLRPAHVPAVLWIAVLVTSWRCCCCAGP